jgi:hypothetical protein
MVLQLLHWTKIYFWALCIAGICFFAAAIAQAQQNEHTLQIGFSFDTQAIPDRQVTGYRIYKEDDLLCESGPVEPQIITCSFISNPGTYAFTLTALYDIGVESPPSAPFTLAIGQAANVQPGDINGDGLIDIRDIILGLQILVNAGSSSSAIEADVNGDQKIGWEEILYSLRRTSQ